MRRINYFLPLQVCYGSCCAKHLMIRTGAEFHLFKRHSKKSFPLSCTSLSCHHTIDKEVFFCPFCGTACEDKKEKPEEEVFREEAVEKTENTPEEDTNFQGTEESEETETRATESGETEETEELGKTEEKISGSEEV